MTTYIWLTLIPLIISASFDLLLGNQVLKQKKFWKLAVIFTIAMVLFDTYVTSWPIVLYNSSHILGIRLGSIPIEDFFYGYTALLVLLNGEKIIYVFKTIYKMAFVSSRPFSWINTAYPLALVFYVSKITLTWQEIALMIFFLFPYNVLVYGVNDIFDYETDKNNPRKQSIEGGLLLPKYHKPLSWLIFSVVLIFMPLMFMGNMIFGVAWLFTILNAIFYSAKPLRLKQIPFLDSLSSSLHFVMPAIIGMLWVGSVTNWWLISSFLFWGMASHVLGAIPDIAVDKKAHEITTATYLGLKKSSLLATSYYVVSLALAYVGNIPLYLVVLLLPYVINSFVILRYQKPDNARKHFRFFMYYNLVYGAIVTISVILM